MLGFLIVSLLFFWKIQDGNLLLLMEKYELIVSQQPLEDLILL